MGAIARNIANNITTSGVFTADAITNASVTGITVLANASDGITLISSQTASNSASLSFTTGIDSTYKAYKFVFVNIQAVSSGNYTFQFNMSTDGGSNYNVTKTSTFFITYHDEADTAASLEYDTGFDLAQSTSFQVITSGIGSASDENASGTLTIFNPASTTYVKHFIADTNNLRGDVVYFYNNKVAGYGNTTSAVNAVQFKMGTGNMNGKIYMYGIK